MRWPYGDASSMRRCVAFALVLCGASSALAQTIPVIEPGREADVQSLFAPHALGDEIAGWRFESIDIDRYVIRVGVIRGDERREMELSHPGRTRGRTTSFAVELDDDPGPALDALLAALERNDAGDFWRAEAQPDPVMDMRRVAGASSLVTDGILWSLLLFAWIVVLAFHASRGAPFERRYLIALVAVAAFVRALLSPHMLLGAWIYSRSTDLQRWIWDSPTLGWLAADDTLAQVDVMMATGFVYAIVTPLAVFAHGRWILDSPRRGLIAAFVLAALPLHVRFSYSEVAFIPSIVLSSTLFATTHFALRSRGVWRVVATFVCVPLTIAVVTARPLNVLFLPLVAWVIVRFAPNDDAPTKRTRAILGASIGISGLFAAASIMWARFSENVRDGLDVEVLSDAFGLLFDLRRNTFINASMTPVLLVALACWGAWMLRHRERGRLAFLGAWIAIFFVTHAYVVPKAPEMQARYHLHLVVPFALIVAASAHELMKRQRWGAWVFCGYVALSPLLHGAFIRDIAFNDHRELAFARSFVEVVPEGCTIREHPGPAGPDDLRVRRIGTEIHHGQRRLRWPEASECVWYFESLACVASKDPDEELDPACVELRRSESWELVRETSFESRIYDGNLARGLREGDIVTLSLYRAR